MLHCHSHSHIFFFLFSLKGNNYLHWFGPQPQLVVAEAELVKEILNNRDGAFPKADSTEFVEKLLGDGLFTADGDKWAKQRKLANHAFHGESLKVSFQYYCYYYHYLYKSCYSHDEIFVVKSALRLESGNESKW